MQFYCNKIKQKNKKIKTITLLYLTVHVVYNMILIILKIMKQIILKMYTKKQIYVFFFRKQLLIIFFLCNLTINNVTIINDFY